MAWTPPRTWLNEDVSRGDMNTHLRDNLLALKYPPCAVYIIQETLNYSTNSTSFTDINATEGKFMHTITTAGDGNGGNGDVFIGLASSVYAATSILIYFRILMDGIVQNADDGLLVVGTSTGIGNASFLVPIRNIPPGQHAFKLQWKVSGGTAILPANAGTSGLACKGEFWVREMS